KEAGKNLKTLDKDFQERVYKLLRERRTVYLTVGHGEINDTENLPQKEQEAEGRSANILRQLLGKQNYTVKDLGLSQGLATDVPADADVVMILGPTHPSAPEELTSLDRYAKRGGKLMMALDPDAVSTDETEADQANPAAAASAAPPKPGKADKAPEPKPAD